MNTERLHRVLVEPRVSEKATQLGEQPHKQFVFRVVKDATKPEIKQAVELMFGVQVEHVRVCNTKGKQKSFRRQRGRRSGFRKAYVCLKEGFDIDFMGRE